MKKVLLVLLISALALSFVSCGKNHETAGSGKNVTLKMGLPNGSKLTPQEIVDGFKAKNPNITLELDETPWSDFKTKLKMQIAASNPPDIFIMDSGYTATLGGMGAALDMSEYIKKDLNADDFTSALDIAKDSTGKVWGVTHSLTTVGILYNKALFDQYNVPYPKEDWTYQDMLDMAAKLTKDTNGDGATDIYGFSPGGNMTTGWLPFILSTGGAPVDETFTKSLFNDPKSVEGIKKYYSIVNELKVSPNNTWITANGNNISAFYSGKVAMIMDMWTNVDNINKNAPAGFSYDAQMMPIGWDGNRSCVYVPNQWVVFSRTAKEKQDAAWEWIKYYLSEESQNIVAKSFTSVGFPIRKSALQTIDSVQTVPANKGAFYKGIDKYGITLFECSTWEEWKPKAEQTFIEMQNNTITPEEAARRIDEVVQGLLKK